MEKQKNKDKVHKEDSEVLLRVFCRGTDDSHFISATNTHTLLSKDKDVDT